MKGFILLQITSFLEVVPSWLPPATIATGHVLLLIGMWSQYLEGKVGQESGYTPNIGRLSASFLTMGIAGATYITIQRANLVLLFAFLIFISGRFIQGAVTMRLIQKILRFFQNDNNNGACSQQENNSISGVTSARLVDASQRGTSYIKSKLRNYIIIFVATAIISTHTALSIAAVYLVGSGSTIEAIERFWVGFFLLTALGLVLDFRYFAHRLSWIAAIGMVLATTGAFLYSPAGFSSFTAVLSPYLNNPVPDWMRGPLGIVGFVFGVLFWAIFYSKKS